MTKHPYEFDVRPMRDDMFDGMVPWEGPFDDAPLFSLYVRHESNPEWRWLADCAEPVLAYILEQQCRERLMSSAHPSTTAKYLFGGTLL
jgi:hypothetical protein